MRKIIVAIIFLFVCQLGLAQVEIGVVTGLNSSNFKGNAPPNTKYTSKKGLYASLLIDWNLAPHFSLSFQPGFSSGGTNIDTKNYETGKYEDSIAISTQVLHFPIFFKIRAMNEKVYFLGGLDFTQLISITYEDEILEEDIKDEVTNQNIHMNFGVGYTIPIKRSSLNIELRYSQGILNLAESEDLQATLPRVKSSAFRLLVGWQIPVIK